MVFDKNWTCGVFRICVFSEIDPKNPKILKFNFQALHARMQQRIFYHCIYLTAFIRFKFCKILINVYKVLLKKISILSKILAFFSMAKIEILKPHISDHRHTICLKFQIWVDDVMINIYVRFKEKWSMMKFPASHLKYESQPIVVRVALPRDKTTSNKSILMQSLTRQIIYYYSVFNCT